MKNKKVNEMENKIRELTDEELAQVTGGDISAGDIVEYGVYFGDCPKCGYDIRCVFNSTMQMFTDIHCTICGHTIPDCSSK